MHVVGNSMGGFAAADLAIHHPARLKTLTLVDAAGVTSNAIAKNPLGEKFALAALGGSPIAGQVDEHGRPRAFDFLRRPAGVHALMAIVARHPTRISRELLAEQLLGTGSPGFIPSMKALIHYDYRGRLGEIASPTLILQGEKDLLVPLGDAYFYEHAIADTELVTFADTGHVPMLERPVAFNEVVLDFVARAEARAATASEPAAAAAE